MLGDTKGPADLGSTRLSKGMRQVPDNRCRHTRLSLSVIKTVALHAGPILFKSTSGMLNKGAIFKTGSNDFATHGVGERDVSPDIEAKPNVRPLGRAGSPRINYIKLGAVPYAFEDVMKKNRVCFTGV